MASLRRIRCTWNGVPSGTGLSTFYSLDADDITAYLNSFLEVARALLITSVSITVPSSGDIIDDVTGEITGTWSGGAGATHVGATGGGMAAPGGIVFEWITNGVVAGRHVRGKFFLVPIASSLYSADGTIDNANLAAMQSAATSFVNNAAPGFRVWSRPFTPPAGSTKPARTGSSSPVAAARVPDMVAILRSRRGRR